MGAINVPSTIPFCENCKYWHPHNHLFVTGDCTNLYWLARRDYANNTCARDWCKLHEFGISKLTRR